MLDCRGGCGDVEPGLFWFSICAACSGSACLSQSSNVSYTVTFESCTKLSRVYVRRQSIRVGVTALVVRHRAWIRGMYGVFKSSTQGVLESFAHTSALTLLYKQLLVTRRPQAYVMAGDSMWPASGGECSAMPDLLESAIEGRRRCGRLVINYFWVGEGKPV